MSEKKKKKIQRQRYGLTCILTNERMNNVIVVIVGKKMIMNTNLL